MIVVTVQVSFTIHIYNVVRTKNRKFYLHKLMQWRPSSPTVLDGQQSIVYASLYIRHPSSISFISSLKKSLNLYSAAPVISKSHLKKMAF